jgi:methionine synthase II (cobalamin-independent)
MLARGTRARRYVSECRLPGRDTLFFRNEFYPSHEEYLFACADALRLEYEAIVASGVGTSGIDSEVIWGKLEALAQGAAIASRRFWR